MTKATLSPKKEVTVRKTAAPARKADTETNESSLPIWKTQHNRVQGAMWRHVQDDGTVRFTVSVSRSYKDKEEDAWKSVHYFDQKDLKDILSIVAEAEEEILKADDTVQEVDED